MARSKKSQYNKKHNRIIYILINPLSKEFFISHCKETLQKNIFYQHCRGRCYQTVKTIDELKKQNLHPCFFILEKLYSTKVEAYNYVIVWTKIFIENGYKNLDHGNILNYISELYEHNLLLYNEKNNYKLEEIIRCENCIVSNYNRKKCQLYNGENNEQRS